MKKILFAALISATPIAIAGSLEPPPGLPAPTFKTLAQIEPRIPLSQASSNGSTIVIDQPGSYYLTENIFQQTAISPSFDLIRINSELVTLDLNGFTLGGAPDAMGGDGIQVDASNVRIYGGNVSGFKGDGIRCAVVTGVNLIDVSSVANGGHGVNCGSISITGGDFSQNVGRGISTVAASRIVDATASFNGGSAIVVGTRGIISRVSVTSLIECSAGGGAIVAESAAGPTGGNGIENTCVRFRSVPVSP